MLYDGVREVADRLEIDTAILHLGGVRFPITGPVRYSMSARDAVELCGLISPRSAIPSHYEGWKHFKEGRKTSNASLRMRQRTSASGSVGCLSALRCRDRRLRPADDSPPQGTFLITRACETAIT